MKLYPACPGPSGYRRATEALMGDFLETISIFCSAGLFLSVPVTFAIIMRRIGARERAALARLRDKGVD
jgi:hypothetical protein